MVVDKVQTKNFYDNYVTCGCDCCKNFILQIEQECPALAKFFKNYEVDIKKPYELMSVNTVEEDSIINYFDCQYLLFGTCPKDFSTEIQGLKITQTFVHPSTKNYSQPNFMLSFSISLKNMFKNI